MSLEGRNFQEQCTSFPFLTLLPAAFLAPRLVPSGARLATRRDAENLECLERLALACFLVPHASCLMHAIDRLERLERFEQLEPAAS